MVDQLSQARGQGHRRLRLFGGIALASEDAAAVVVATEVVRALPLANLLTGCVGFRCKMCIILYTIESKFEKSVFNMRDVFPACCILMAQLDLDQIMLYSSL